MLKISDIKTERRAEVFLKDETRDSRKFLDRLASAERLRLYLPFDPDDKLLDDFYSLFTKLFKTEDILVSFTVENNRKLDFGALFRGRYYHIDLREGFEKFVTERYDKLLA